MVFIDKHPLLITRGTKPRKGVVATCICGKEIYVMPSVIRPNNFCSRECVKNRSNTKLRLNCKYCGKQYLVSRSQKRHRGSSFCSRVCQGSYKSVQQTGNKNPGWRGGVSKDNHRIRQSKQFKEWREAVFKRDNYTCVFCGERGGYLEPDHIKPFAYFPEVRFELDNGRTLCKPCHKTTDTYGNKAKRQYEKNQTR